jgi:hypothetical protein
MIDESVAFVDESVFSVVRFFKTGDDGPIVWFAKKKRRNTLRSERDICWRCVPNFLYYPVRAPDKNAIINNARQ